MKGAADKHNNDKLCQSLRLYSTVVALDKAEAQRETPQCPSFLFVWANMEIFTTSGDSFEIQPA